MMNNKVSILMNCYNGEKFVSQALDSVFAQTYDNFEVIFIDNCSVDDSAKIASSYGDKVKIYKTPENMSLCRARVFAKQFITGDYFCVLDIDDLWMPDKLEKQVQFLDANKDFGAVYTNTIYFSGDGDKCLAYDSEMPSGDIFEPLLAGYFLSFETVMVRKSIMDEWNIYFDDRYNVSSDMEFFVKLSYRTKFKYLPEALAKWRFGHGNESVSQYESFPREYEILLEDLNQLIPNFKEEYAQAILKLEGVINNMKGISSWKKGNRKKAREYFKNATKTHKKYFVPLIFSVLTSFKTYERIRLLGRKI